MVRFIGRVLLIAFFYLFIFALGYFGFATYQHNLTGWFLIFTAFAYGFGGPYLLWTELKKENIVRHENKDRSFWLVIPGFLMVFYAPPLEYIFKVKILPYSIWMQIVGLILIGISMLLFSWARIALRGLYSGRVRVKEDHTLIQNGPYRIIRHPAYAAYNIMGLGIAIGYSSLIGLLAVPFLLLPALIYRINVEEKILSAEFGCQYNQYIHNTKRLIPLIW
jgi:protein-S-isoprenylcysteine O-methyltransferase Ste14